MSDHVDHLHGFLDSARRSCSFLNGWIYNLISRCPVQVGFPFRILRSASAEEEKDNFSTLIDAMNPIDISSSDSDWDEIDNYRDSDNDSPSPPEIRHDTNARSTGFARQSQKINSPNQAQLSSLNSLNVNNNSQRRATAHDPNNNIEASTQPIAIDDGPDTRTLPLSRRLLGSSSKSDKLIENVSGSQIRDAHGSSNHLAGPSFSNIPGYTRDRYSGGYNDEVMMYGNSSRIFPPYVMHGKSVTYTEFDNPDNLVYRAGVSEERVPLTDERMIYQAALEDLNQPKIEEATLPDGLLSVPLLRHQKIALHWMLQRETRSGYCLGGILADDQGLGKTISMIALIQMQKILESKSKSEDVANHKTVALNLDDDDDNGIGASDKVNQSGQSDDTKSIPEVSISSGAFSRQRLPAGTLVVCPASVLRQWARELDDKVADESKLSVLIYHGVSRTKDPSELSKYDVVLTTYSIVTNEVPKQPLVDDDESDERNGEKYGLSSEFPINKKRKTISDVGKKGKKGREGNGGSVFDSSTGALARLAWFRVILDEAQTIKNHRTQVARACCSLRAKRRWCLSGTPIQNAIDDLYSYFRFLKHEPYYIYKAFYNGIKVPISRDSVKGYKKLQAVLKTVMLRRTKETMIDGAPIIKLPPKSIHMTKVDFSAEERDFYSQLEADSRSQFKAYAAAGTLNQNYANILLMLLRLRQACGHPLLVKGFNSDSIRESESVGQVSVEMAKKLPREKLINLVNCLETSFAICSVCSDPPDDPVVTMCGHVFCYQCVSEYLTGDDNTCPAAKCKKQLGAGVVFSRATLSSCIADGFNASTTHPQFSEKSKIFHNEYSSAKIKAVIDILRSKCFLKNSSSELQSSNGHHETSLSSEQTCTESDHSGISIVKHPTVFSKSLADRPNKAIIFSQWTSMLDLVEHSLCTHNINYRRLDGTMSLAARDRNVRDFNTDPEVTVMLLSLKAGNLGLNMVAACHVILLDLWWNPTTEDQAIDRAHRIGQSRAVTVHRITIKDTVEDRILSLQDDKRNMVASAFGGDQSGGAATRLTVEDLKYLFMG